MSVEFDVKCTNISIHALREEGDCPVRVGDLRDIEISIHALREEGDYRLPAIPHRQLISIHALREEGDDKHALVVKLLKIFLSTPSARRATGLVADIGDVLGHFYPRPPRGGRPLQPVGLRTPDVISIHALREEGDRVGCRTPAP